MTCVPVRTAALSAGHAFQSVAPEGCYRGLEVELKVRLTSASPWFSPGFTTECSNDSGATSGAPGSGEFSAIGSATSYNDTGLSPGTSYTYEVVATTSSESSAASASAGTVTLPSSLSGLTATAASSTEVDLAWTDVTGATGYEIDRKDADGNWEAPRSRSKSWR